jgi:hypothetical protein
MNNTYTWVIKNLNTDHRGYASNLYMELQGTDGINTVVASSISVFGGNDYKPASQWTQQSIDDYAMQHEINLKASIDEQLQTLKARIETLEAK